MLYRGGGSPICSSLYMSCVHGPYKLHPNPHPWHCDHAFLYLSDLCNRVKMSSTGLRHARNLWLGNLDTDTQGACHRMISCGRNWSEGSIAKEHQVTCHYQKPEERHRTASPLEPQEGPNSADSRPPTPCGNELSSFCRVHSSCYSNRRNLMCQWARWLTTGLGGGLPYILWKPPMATPPTSYPSCH